MVRIAVTAAVLLALLCTHRTAQAQAIQQETIFELENATLPQPGWSAVTATATEPGYATVAVGPTTSATDETVAPLTLTLSSTRMATYHVWLRFIAPNDGSDSFWASVGDGIKCPETGTPYCYFDSGQVYGLDGVWKEIGTVTLDAGGSAQIRLKYREARLRFDKLIVTALPNYKPTGTGEVPTVSNSIPPNPSQYTPDILPPIGHPRLFLGNSIDKMTILESKRLAYLPANEHVPEHKRLRKAWERLTEAATAPALGIPTDAAKCADYAKAIQGKALYSQLYPDTTMGPAAVAMMRTYIDVCAFEETKEGARVALTTRPAGDMITLSAIVYDWCKEFVNEEDEELYLRRFLERAPMEIGFPPEKQGHLVGHGSEHQLMRDQLSFAIAFHGKESRLYDIVGAKFFEDFVPARRDYLYKSGAFHQGMSYGQARYVSDMFAAWLFKRMAGVDVFGDAGKDMLYHPMHMRRPDGQLMRDGDTFESTYTPPGMYWFQPFPYMLAANYFRDPVLKQEYARQIGLDDRPEEDLWHVLFSDNTFALSSPVPALPLTKFYGAPAGYMVARTGWPQGTVNNASSEVVATMKVGHTNFANHQHLDAGHFQLYYKGALAIDSGIYEGKNNDESVSYGKPHDWNYHKRTIAHNAMLVFQPGEKFGDAQAVSNDGGQRFITEEPESLDMLHTSPNKYEYGGNICHKAGPDPTQPIYSYLKGDLHHAYSDKVANYQRAFVFFNLNRADVPAALVVFDRIRSSNPAYQKRWLLHSVGEPVINEAARTITIERRDLGYNGRLINRTLLPEQAIWTKHGGPGQEYLVPDTAGTAMVNYPIEPANINNTEEGGAWRAEVSPSAPQESDLMLNVMQVMDADSTSRALATELLQSDHFVGVRIAARFTALFGKGETNVGEGATFTLPGLTGTSDVLVTDLEPGSWTVQRNGAAVSGPHTATADEGTIYLPGLAAGSYTLRLSTASK